ncbi:MAG: hypothetical protein U0872_06325 [Planctomycetaceae bacterium]
MAGGQTARGAGQQRADFHIGFGLSELSQLIGEGRGQDWFVAEKLHGPAANVRITMPQKRRSSFVGEAAVRGERPEGFQGELVVGAGGSEGFQREKGFWITAFGENAAGSADDPIVGMLVEAMSWGVASLSSGWESPLTLTLSRGGGEGDRRQGALDFAAKR